MRMKIEVSKSIFLCVLCMGLSIQSFSQIKEAGIGLRIDSTKMANADIGVIFKWETVESGAVILKPTEWLVDLDSGVYNIKEMQEQLTLALTLQRLLEAEITRNREREAEIARLEQTIQKLRSEELEESKWLSNLEKIDFKRPDIEENQFTFTQDAMTAIISSEKLSLSKKEYYIDHLLATLNEKTAVRIIGEHGTTLDIIEAEEFLNRLKFSEFGLSTDFVIYMASDQQIVLQYLSHNK